MIERVAGSGTGSKRDQGRGDEGAPRQGPFPCLDAYRAIGMVMILAFHAYFYSLAHKKGIFGPLLARFDVALPFFFVLSGFLLFRPYVDALFAERTPISASRFLRNRAVRIFPAWWFALLGAVVLFHVRFHSAGEFFTFAFLLQIYRSAKVFDPRFQPIYQSWSLATEIGFYVLQPVLAWALRRTLTGRDERTKIVSLVAVVAGFYVAGTAFRAAVVTVKPGWQKAAALAVPSWLDIFAIGMALAVASVWHARTGRQLRVLDYLSRHLLVSWGLAAGFFWISTRFSPPKQPLVFHGREYVARYFLYGLVALFFLLPAMIGDQRVGRVRAVLSSRLMVLLGTVSLGFYLFHVGFLGKAQSWTGAAAFQASFVKEIAIALPLTLVAATVSYLAVERPALRLKSWRRRRTRQVGEVSA
jgi:peptidoglycan/LPS O-acetylase OafA/YrhL